MQFVKCCRADSNSLEDATVGNKAKPGNGLKADHC